MATDYDAPRKTDDDVSEDSIEELKSRRGDASSSNVDVDETEMAEGFELPGADLSGEEMSVRRLFANSIEPKVASSTAMPSAALAATRSTGANRSRSSPV